MIKMNSLTVPALCFLTAACAAAPEKSQSNGATGDSPVDIVEQYYAKKEVPEGWRIESISGRQTVLVTVMPSMEQWAKTLAQSTPGSRALQRQVCPQRSAAAWKSVAGEMDIAISVVVIVPNVPNAPNKLVVDCDQHDTT